MTRILLKIINVFPGEEKPVLLLLGKGFFMGIFLATYKVVAEAFFLASLGEYLAEAMFFSALIGVISTALFATLQNKIHFKKLVFANLVLVFLFFGSARYLFEVLSGEYRDYLVFAIFVMLMPIYSITILGFWGVFGRTFDLRQSKRIIGGIDSGQLMGSIITFYSVSLLNKYLENIDFLFISMASLVFSFIFLLFLDKGSKIQSHHREKGETRINTKLTKLLKNKYVVLLSCFLGLSMVAFTFVAYSFLSVTEIYFPSEEQLLSFLGIFNGSIMILGLLIQTFVNDRLIAMYGLRTALLVLPIILLFFTIASIVAATIYGLDVANDNFLWFFLFIALSKLFTDSLRDALENPSFKLFFMPLDVKIRFDIQAKVEGVVNEFSRFVAGGLILILGVLTFVNIIHYTYFLLVIIGAWIYITNRLYNEYRQNVKRKLQGHQEEEDLHQKLKNSLRKELDLAINSQKMGLIIFASRLLEKIDVALLRSKITSLINSADSGIRKIALELLNEQRSITQPTSGKVFKISEEKNHVENLASWMSNINVSSSGSLGFRDLSILTRSEDVNDRKYAAALIHSSVSSDENISFLIELMNDINPGVRNAAFQAAAKTNKPEVIPLLIDNLSSSTYGDRAMNALIQIGNTALPFLENAFYRSGQDIETMLRILRIYGAIGNEKALELIWNKIDFPDKKVVSHVLLALGNCGFEARGTQVTNIKFAIESDISNYTWNLNALEVLPQDEAGRLLRNAIIEENQRNLDHIFMLLSMIFDPHSVQLVKENIETKTSEGITYAIELFDVFLSEDLKDKIIPLIDDILPSDKLRKLQDIFPQIQRSFAATVKQIINRDYNQINRWTKACAIYNVGIRKWQSYNMDLIANLFNPDALIMEITAWAIHKIDPSLYHKNIKRIPVKLRQNLNRIIEGQELDLKKFTLIKLLQNAKLFKGNSGLQLSSLVDRIELFSLNTGEIIYLNEQENKFFFLVCYGELSFRSESVMQFREGDFIGEHLQEKNNIPKIMALSKTILLKIEKDKFYDYLINNHDMALTMLKNLNRNLEDPVKQGLEFFSEKESELEL